MKNKTQKERVIEKLLKDGYITRNTCLSMFPAITRLGAIICTLQEEGWIFEARYGKDNKDYGYITKHCPLQRSVYKVGDRTIETYKK